MAGTVTSRPDHGARRTGSVAALPHATAWLGFLADDERVAPSGHKTITAAAACLDGPANPVALLTGCNLLALALFRQRRLDEARHVCLMEIEYAQRQRDRGFLFHALQPQINVLRMEGFTGDVDEALRGFAALEPLAEGRPASLPLLDIDAAAITSMTAAGLRPGSLALAVRAVDTCKILWRRGHPDRLLAEARRMLRLWPHLAAGAEPHHPAEALWMVRPLERPPEAMVPSSERGDRGTRLGLLRTLHLASAAAQSGLPHAGRLAHRLFELPEVLTGTFLSPLTPARWLASLGDTLLRTGQRAEAATVLRDSLTRIREFGDDKLAWAVSERLALADSDATPGPAPADPRPPADEDLTRLTSLAMSRLGSN